MRPVVLHMGVTLDGFVHGAAGYRADWSESRIASGDLAEDIDGLKQEPGGMVLAHGGATFGALREPLRLNLIEARTFTGGTAVHRYQPTGRH